MTYFGEKNADVFDLERLCNHAYWVYMSAREKVKETGFLWIEKIGYSVYTSIPFCEKADVNEQILKLLKQIERLPCSSKQAYRRLFNVFFIFVHISCQSKVSNLCHISVSEKNVSCSQIPMQYLRSRGIQSGNYISRYWLILLSNI